MRRRPRRFCTGSMLELISSGFDEFLLIVDRLQPGYIYLVLFGMAFLENIFPPLPGDTFTIIGGYLAALGKLEVTLVLVSVTVGTMASVMTVYGIGYLKGRDYFIRKQLRIFNAHDIGRVEDWFRRFGIWTLLFSRFVVGGRVAIALGSGLSKYPPAKMTAYSFISTLAFHGTLVVLAYVMHAYITGLVDGVNLYSKIVLVILGVLVILWLILIIRRLRNGKREA